MEETFGKYRLLRPLAQGGMAEIFLAQQEGPEGFRKRVVVKRALAHLTSRPEFTAMFQDEARLMARLSHPNIVQVFDFGECDGRFFFAMEYLAGEDLAAVVSRSRNLGRVVPGQVAAVIAMQVCEALTYVHALSDGQGNLLHVVHRDVSPSNVLITYQGLIKVLDFGIAKAKGKSSETQIGTLKGKFAYMSPEQARGQPLDGRSDLFSLGAVLYELLTGVRLFKRKSHLEVLQAVTADPIQSPRASRPDLPEELERIVMKALTRDVALRYQTAAEMHEDFDRFLAARTYVPNAGLLQHFLEDLFGEEHIRDHTQSDEDTLSSPNLRADALGERPTAPHSIPEIPVSDGWLVRSEVESSSLLKRPRFWGLGVTGAALIAVAAFALGRSTSRSPPAPPPAVEQTLASPETLAAAPPQPPAPTAAQAAPANPGPTPAPGPVLEQAPRSAEKPHATGAKRAPAPSAPRSLAPGSLAVNCAPWCRIFVDGRDTGQTSPASGISLKPGRHKLRVVNPPSGKERTRTVSVPAGEQVVETVDFEDQ